ncbi:MAG: hypothetical protein LWX08_03705 [Deltaproteobacteria bacterium]|jgi:hypothetical protein|nr:hypothetical protein [Deltaproteobacteria bacterium]
MIYPTTDFWELVLDVIADSVLRIACIKSTTDFWELVLDVIGLSLCGITILHLIRNRSKYNQSLLKEPGEENYNRFNEEVLAQLVKQQSDMPFETISDAIEKERMPLHSLKPFSAKDTGQVQEGSYNKKSSGSDDLAGDEYDEVARLADLGLSVKKISKRAKIPRGEVELVVKLRGLEN